MRPSHPTLVAIGSALRSRRDRIVTDWAQWMEGRTPEPAQISGPVVRRFLALLVDVLVETTGPRRRPALELWQATAESFGRVSADRALAAGEVVEEFQQLRELLIRYLSEPIALLTPRASIAATLRLNRIVDQGVAYAVVGYTDALFEALLAQGGVPVGGRGEGDVAAIKRLKHLEAELAALKAP